MSTFSKGRSRRILRLEVYKKVSRKLFALSVILLFFSNFSAFSQCPEFSPNNTNITVDKFTGNISITTTYDIDFNTVRVLVWNFDSGAYFYDSEHEIQKKDAPDIRVRVGSKEIVVRKLPSGDYSIVIEKDGCKIKQIGLGYSGLPNSGIKIE